MLPTNWLPLKNVFVEDILKRLQFHGDGYPVRNGK